MTPLVPWGACALAILSFSLPSLARAGAEAPALVSSETEYGSVYLTEQREAPVRSWQLGLDYAREVDNAYLNVNGITASIARGLSPHFALGAQFAKFFASESELTQAVRHGLRSEGITQIVHKPSSAFYGTATLVPLSGMLNLFNRSTLPFELGLTLGAGMTAYANSTRHLSLLWQVSPQLLVSDALGVRLSMGQHVESPFGRDRLARLEGRFGVFMRL